MMNAINSFEQDLNQFLFAATALHRFARDVYFETDKFQDPNQVEKLNEMQNLLDSAQVEFED